MPEGFISQRLMLYQHGHLAQYGEFLHSVDLFGSTSVKDAKDRLTAYALAHEGVGSRENWIRGVGWDQMVLGEMPTAVGVISKAPNYSL